MVQLPPREIWGDGHTQNKHTSLTQWNTQLEYSNSGQQGGTVQGSKWQSVCWCHIKANTHLISQHLPYNYDLIIKKVRSMFCLGFQAERHWDVSSYSSAVLSLHVIFFSFSAIQTFLFIFLSTTFLTLLFSPHLLHFTFSCSFPVFFWLLSSFIVFLFLTIGQFHLSFPSFFLLCSCFYLDISHLIHIELQFCIVPGLKYYLQLIV